MWAWHRHCKRRQRSYVVEVRECWKVVSTDGKNFKRRAAHQTWKRGLEVPLEKRISQFCSFPTEPKESEKMKIFQDDLKNVWTGENQVPHLNNSFNWNLNQGSCDPISVVKETWSRKKNKKIEHWVISAFIMYKKHLKNHLSPHGWHLLSKISSNILSSYLP